MMTYRTDDFFNNVVIISRIVFWRWNDVFLDMRSLSNFFSDCLVSNAIL